MQNLDPQDQPEQLADLATLDDAGLATEAKRETLRDQRQARRLASDYSTIDRGRQLVILGLLIVAALGAIAAVLVGLVRNSEGLVRVGLLALCALFGGALYRPRSRWSNDPR